MRFEKFTVKAQEAVVGAQELAQQHDNPEILPLHLLGALLAETDGVVPAAKTSPDTAITTNPTPYST